MSGNRNAIVQAAARGLKGSRHIHVDKFPGRRPDKTMLVIQRVSIVPWHIAFIVDAQNHRAPTGVETPGAVPVVEA